MSEPKFEDFNVPNSSIVLKLMERKHIDKAIEVYSIGFSTPTEPTSGFLKLDAWEFDGLMRPLLENHVDDGLSFVAVDGPDEEVVGMFFHKDFRVAMEGNPYPPKCLETFKKSRKLQIFEEFLHPIEKEEIRFIREKKYKKVVHMFAWAVLEKARGKRLTTYVSQFLQKMSKERGFEMIFAECTNIFSERVILRSFKGSEIVMKLYYDTFEFSKDNSKPYAGCNEFAVNWMKEKNIYKEEYKDVCRHSSLIVFDVKK